jgi:hypothetical protein
MHDACEHFYESFGITGLVNKIKIDTNLKKNSF